MVITCFVVGPWRLWHGLVFFFYPTDRLQLFQTRKKSLWLDFFFYFKFPTDWLGKIGSSLIRHSRNQPPVALRWSFRVFRGTIFNGRLWLTNTSIAGPPFSAVMKGLNQRWHSNMNFCHVTLCDPCCRQRNCIFVPFIFFKVSVYSAAKPNPSNV